MTFTSSIALFVLMAGLAALPSSSVLLVVTRSATSGVKSGLATATGVVVGDLIFMTMAIVGMTALASQMGTLFVVIKYVAGVYLIWLGYNLIMSRNAVTKIEAHEVGSNTKASTLLASFGAGLLLTLGDVKAIFFYASLLPSFLDLSSLTLVDIIIVSFITIIAVGGVKAAYALGAGGAVSLAKNFRFESQLKIFAGVLMILIGLYLFFRS